MEPQEDSILTSKLSLFSLGRASPEMQSPPLHTLASIPFQWEEAPGKPRKTLPPPPTPPGKSKSLELPPRLANETFKASSPLTVLDGPYKGPSNIRSISFSSPKFGSFRSPKAGLDGSGNNSKRKNTSRMMMVFTSSRWNGGSKSVQHEDRSFDFSVSSSSSSCSSSSGVNEKKINEGNKVKKVTTVGRRSKNLLFTFSGATSDLLQTILKSISKRSP